MARSASLTLLVLCFTGIFAVAQEGGDLQAQILYAYHSENSAQLTSLIQTLSTQVQAGSPDKALRYHLAHAEYRSGLLAGAGHAHDAETAFAVCIDQLKPLLEQDRASVEVLILQSACYAGLAGVKHLESVLLRTRANERLRSALNLEPRNPRALLLSALEGFAGARAGSPEAARAFAQLQLAAQLFEQTSATSVDVPGWGHAEAYLELGRQLEARGDVPDARNWIEKALIASPDFKAAQRQKAELMHR
jgi:tetratricopeptide (TPR) repeat protein